MDFGVKLKQLRESKGFGVNQLAQKSGVNASQISRFENGQRKEPTLETVKKLSNALGVSVSYFTEEENKIPHIIAAHIDDGITDKEMEEILNYIEFIKNKRRKS